MVNLVFIVMKIMMLMGGVGIDMKKSLWSKLAGAATHRVTLLRKWMIMTMIFLTMNDHVD